MLVRPARKRLFCLKAKTGLIIILIIIIVKEMFFSFCACHPTMCIMSFNVDHSYRLVQAYRPKFVQHPMLTPFLEIDSKFGTRVLWSPTQPLTNVLFCFFVGNFGSLNIRKTNKKVSGEKHTHSSTAGLKFIGHGCHIFG